MTIFVFVFVFVFVKIKLTLLKKIDIFFFNNVSFILIFLFKHDNK